LARRKKKQKKAYHAQPYKHPIPGPNELIDFLQEVGKPLKAEAILKAFGLKGQRTRSLLVDRLYAMVRAGKILENRRGEYCLTAKLDLVTGTVSGHRDGFGFVARDDFDGDRVAVRIIGMDRRGRAEGELVDVLERRVQQVAGKFIRERGIGIVIPDNARIAHRILIPKDAWGGAKPGQVVVAEIVDYPTQVEQSTGRIIDVLGAPDEKGIATEIAIHSHAIPYQWPRSVVNEAGGFGTTVPSKAKEGRYDLRDVDLVTIDGADARDFDDAVYCERSGSGWTLLVAIADVSHYVKVGSALDKEAIRRGTSVYFPDRVVPMLPEALSNGLCSLNPKVDRLCMVCEMQVNAQGKVTGSEFYEAVMRSKARLMYGQVGAFLEGRSPKAIPADLHASVRELHALYKALARARKHRGAIEMDLPQTKFKLNKAGEIDRIEVVPRNDAHRLIEECMIAANVEADCTLCRWVSKFLILTT
jgi:ribonuclease R